MWGQESCLDCSQWNSWYPTHCTHILGFSKYVINNESILSQDMDCIKLAFEVDITATQKKRIKII